MGWVNNAKQQPRSDLRRGKESSRQVGSCNSAELAPSKQLKHRLGLELLGPHRCWLGKVLSCVMFDAKRCKKDWRIVEKQSGKCFRWRGALPKVDAGGLKRKLIGSVRHGLRKPGTRGTCPSTPGL